MALAVPQQWTSSGGRDDVRLNVTPTAGNWVLATIAYRTTDGTAPLATVADLTRNYWELVGSAADASGAWRVEVWACPQIVYAPSLLDVIYAAVSHIHADDVGTCLLHVTEVSGFVNGFPTIESATVGTASAAAGLSIIMPTPAGSASCFVLAAAAINDSTKTLTAPAAGGWTALTQVTRSSPDIKMGPSWRTATATQTATWSISAGTTDWVGVVVALRETGTVWTPAISGRPAARFRLAPGQGLDTPLPRASWTEYTTRLEAIRASHGIPYELGRAQAGESLAVLQNSDGALNPEPGGDFDISTPFSLDMAWPNGSTGKIYPVAYGWSEKFSRRWAAPQVGYADMSGVDVLATAVRAVKSPLRAETLRHRPYAYWTLGDPAGSLTALNSSGRSSTVLVGTISKYGAAASTADFGASTQAVTIGSVTGTLVGDTGTGWQQAGLVLADTTKGRCLVATDDDFPSITSGVTIAGSVFLADGAAQPNIDSTVFIIRNLDPGGGVSLGSVLKLSMQRSSNKAQITVWDKATHATTTTTGASTLIANNGFRPFVVRITPTTWSCTIAGVTFTGSCNLVGNWDLISLMGEADQFSTNRMCNGIMTHVAVFDRYLTDGETSLWASNAHNFAYAGEYTHKRAQRILATGGSSAPRVIDFTPVLSSTIMSNDPGTGPMAQAIGDVADAEATLAYGRADGALAVRGKWRAYQQAPVATLGDDTGAGEIPYIPGQLIEYDRTNLYNEVEVSNSYETSVSTANPTVHASVDTASVDRYGGVTLPRDTRLADSCDAFALADWLLNQYHLPKSRLATVTIDPASFPSTGWPFVLSVEVGDLLTVKGRPVGAPVDSIACQVMKIDVAATPAQYRLTLTLAGAPPQVLVLGDASRTLGNSTIGW